MTTAGSTDIASSKKKVSPQIVGNAALFATARAMSILGWNVLITSRNAKGPDILAYDDVGQSITVQVKGSSSDSKRRGFGVLTSTKDRPVARNEIDAKVRANASSFWIFVRNAMSAQPIFFIMSPEEIVQNCNDHGWCLPSNATEGKWERLGSPIANFSDEESS